MHHKHQRNYEEYNSSSTINQNNFKTPVVQKQNFNKYLNCQPPTSLSQLIQGDNYISQKKFSVQDQFQKTTSIYEDLLMSSQYAAQQNKDKSPLIIKDGSSLLDNFNQYPMTIRRGSVNNTQKKKSSTRTKNFQYVMSERTNPSNLQQQLSSQISSANIKGSIYQEVINEKINKSSHNLNASSCSVLDPQSQLTTERMSVDVVNSSNKSRETNRKKSLGYTAEQASQFFNYSNLNNIHNHLSNNKSLNATSNCHNQLFNHNRPSSSNASQIMFNNTQEGVSDIIKQSQYKKSSESRKVFDEEFNNLLKRIDKKNLLPQHRQNYTRTDLYKFFKQIDTDTTISEQNSKSQKIKHQSILKEKTENERKLQDLQKKVEYQNVLLSKFTSQEYLKKLEDELKYSNNFMKQIRMTIGFLLSFYKEIQDIYDSPFENEMQSNLSYTLDKFKINEVFTDIDMVQSKIQEYDKLFNIIDDKPLQLQSYQHNQSYLNQIAFKTKIYQRDQQSPKVYHKQTINSENALKREIEMQKIVIQKLKKDLSERDYYIQQLKKGLNDNSEKSQLVVKLMQFDKDKELFRVEQENFTAQQQNIPQDLVKKQAELDEKSKLCNLLNEKEKNLLIEIEELRGLLSNNQSIKQLENTISQLSGILLSNNSGLKFTDSQMRQLLYLFNFKEQVARVNTHLSREFEESGIIIDNFMQMIEYVQQHLPDDEFILKQYSCMRDLIFAREKRYQNFERLSKSHSNEASRYEFNNFNTTSKSIFDLNDDQTMNLFEEFSHISSLQYLPKNPLKSNMSQSQSINELMLSEVSRSAGGGRRKTSNKSRKRSKAPLQQLQLINQNNLIESTVNLQNQNLV
eukprot:403376330